VAWLGKFRKTASVALVALVVSLSMVMVASDAGNVAQAFIPPSSVVAMGEATVTAAEAVVAASPVGWIVGGIAAGALLYMTSDKWLPWVKGLFVYDPPGPGDATVTAPPGTRCRQQANPLGLVANANGESLVVSSTILVNGSVGGSFYCSNAQLTSDYIAQCINVNSGALFTRTGNSIVMGQWGTTTAGGGVFTTTQPNWCNGTAQNPARVIAISGWTGAAATSNMTSDSWSWKTTNAADLAVLEGTRDTTTTKTCVNATTSVSVSATITGGAGAPGVNCPAGTVADSVKVTSGYDTADQRTIATASVPASAKTAYPTCVGPGSIGQPVCTLMVFLDGTVCTVSRTECAAWDQVNPARIECHYGQYVLTGSAAATECASIKNGYVTGLLTVDTNAAQADPAQQIVPANADGSVYAPAAPATTATGTATATGSGTATAGAPAPGQAGTPADLPSPASADESACFPSGWSVLNPVEWVLKPVKCALSWAFVPPAGTITSSMSGLITAWKTSGPGAYMDGIGAAVGGMTASASGCQGPGLSFSTTLSGGQTLYPLNACNPPVSTVASIVNTCLTLLIWVGCFAACAQMVLGSFGIRFAGFLRSGSGGEA
jgi:hypothetical protein